MNGDEHDDPSDRARISEEDVFLAGLVGAYADRRDRGQLPHAHDLLARAAEFGDAAAARTRCTPKARAHELSDGTDWPPR